MNWAALVAVAGTLGGVGLTVWGQLAQARARWRVERRDATLAAVATLVAALADHRRAMWLRETARLAGFDWEAERGVSHATRAALTAPLVTVGALAPGLVEPARAAERAAYALRDAPDGATLTRLRDAAVRATDALVDAAGRELA